MLLGDMNGDAFNRKLAEIVERDMPMMKRMAAELCDRRELENLFALDSPGDAGIDRESK